MQDGQMRDDMEHMLMQVLQMLLGCERYSRYNQIASKALELYTEFSSRYRVKGRRIMTYTAIYVVLRLEGYAITLNAFASRIGIDARRLASCYRAMRRVLGLTIPNPTLHAYMDELVGWIGYCVKDRHKGIDAVRLKEEAYRLADHAQSMMNGKGVNPAGTAAAIVYLALDDDGRRTVSIKDLAKVSGVSIVTVKKRMEELRPLLNVHLARAG